MITTLLVGRPDGLADALAADPRFSLAESGAADLVYLTTGGAEAAAVLGSDVPVLVAPQLLGDPEVAALVVRRAALTHCALAAHQGASVRSALATLASGRLGLPWNVQADVITTGKREDLLGVAAEPIDVVLRAIRLRVRSVVARSHQNANGAGQATVHCTHERGATSTVVVGVIPALGETSERGASELRHRYRISGSHGELLIDGLQPAVKVHTATTLQRRWSGPSADEAILNAIAQAVASKVPGPAEDLSELASVLAAAKESAASGQPVELQSVA